MNFRTRKLRAWMALNGLKVSEIADANNVSLTAVYRFIDGNMTSAKISDWFKDQGCPASVLAAKNSATMRKVA